MPKKLTKYACNYCGQEYDTEIEAIDCEQIPVGKQPSIGAKVKYWVDKKEAIGIIYDVTCLDKNEAFFYSHIHKWKVTILVSTDTTVCRYPHQYEVIQEV